MKLIHALQDNADPNSLVSRFRRARAKRVTALIEAIHAVLEHTPAELAADVFDNGIVLSGGGARLSGLADAISTALKVDCRVADNPQECVATGCGLTLENLAEFGRYLNDGRRR